MKVYKEFDAVQFDGTEKSLEGLNSKIEYVPCVYPQLEYQYLIDGTRYTLNPNEWVLKDSTGVVTILSEKMFKDNDFKEAQRGGRPRPTEEARNFAELCSLNREKIYRLLELGVLTDGKDNVRDHNVGVSNYATHTIQAWSVWEDWNLNPWDADIVKRIERTKEGEEPTERYEKIIHIANERLRQLRLERDESESQSNRTGTQRYL